MIDPREAEVLKRASVDELSQVLRGDLRCDLAGANLVQQLLQLREGH
jgi:hypothetical protein